MYTMLKSSKCVIHALSTFEIMCVGVCMGEFGELMTLSCVKN